jgi:hypothetical protein
MIGAEKSSNSGLSVGTFVRDTTAIRKHTEKIRQDSIAMREDIKVIREKYEKT